MKSLARAILLLVAASPTDADVLVVDDDGGQGVDYKEIQAAVVAAESGDTVLIRSGVYRGFVVVAKSIVVTADRDADVLVRDPVRTQWQGPDDSVVLRGLTIETDDWGGGLSLASGHVWVEDTIAPGANTSTNGPNGRTTFHRCAFHGATATSEFFAGGSGLSTDWGAHAYAFDCEIVGGDGAVVDDEEIGPYPTQGGPALFVVPYPLWHGQAITYLSGCTLVGGNGADGMLFDGGCYDGQRGGDAHYSDGGTAYQADVTKIPGAGGAGIGSCSAGADGLKNNLAGSTLVDLPGTSRSLRAEGVARAGEIVDFTYDGVAGDVVFLLLSQSQDPRFVPPDEHFAGGAILPGANRSTLLHVGTAASDVLAFSFVAPSPPGDAVTYFTQAIAISPAQRGKLVCSSGQTLTILDPAL